MSPEDDKPRGAYWWARRWRVHPDTARRILAHLHRTLGSKVVWRVGPNRALVTTVASLRVISVLREGHQTVVVVGRPDAPPARWSDRDTDDRDDLVTNEQLHRVISDLRREIETLRKR